VIPLSPVDWQIEIKCAGLPIRKSDAMFLPDRGGSSKAARMCAGCAVRSECLEHALDNVEQLGIWGGSSERERRVLRRKRRAA